MSRPKKRLGQHFLTDPRILTRIADAVAPEPDETVFEVGPGRGGLTAYLAERAARLVLIEKDSDLVPALRERFPQVQLVEGDALDLDWHAIVGHDPAVIAGNIPYRVTSPLIDWALSPPRPRRVVYLVQKEVAERLVAPPGGKDFGALSVGVQAVARVERLFKVGRGSFHPQPRVDSTLVRILPIEPSPVPDGEAAGFRRFVVGLFGFRRKQLLRGLRELTGLAPDVVAGVLGEIGIREVVRPEELPVPTFLALHRALQARLVGHR
jgi:16S rRNA (adenine1518-N6/adenine1519-N6)-dimethyltransferase